MGILSDAIASANNVVGEFEANVISVDPENPQANIYSNVDTAAELTVYYDTVNSRMNKAINALTSKRQKNDETFIGVNMYGDTGSMVRPVVHETLPLDPVSGLPTGSRTPTNYTDRVIYTGDGLNWPNSDADGIGFPLKGWPIHIYDYDNYTQLINKDGWPIYGNDRGLVDPIGEALSVNHWGLGNRSDSDPVYPAGFSVDELTQLGPFKLWEPQGHEQNFDLYGSGVLQQKMETYFGEWSGARLGMLTAPCVSRMIADLAHNVTLPFYVMRGGRAWNNGGTLDGSIDNGNHTLPPLGGTNRMLHNLTWEMTDVNGPNGVTIPSGHQNIDHEIGLNWDPGLDPTFTQNEGSLVWSHPSLPTISNSGGSYRYELLRFGFFETKLGNPANDVVEKRRELGNSIGFITPLGPLAPQ